MLKVSTCRIWNTYREYKKLIETISLNAWILHVVGSRSEKKTFVPSQWMWPSNNHNLRLCRFSMDRIHWSLLEKKRHFGFREKQGSVRELSKCHSSRISLLYELKSLWQWQQLSVSSCTAAVSSYTLKNKLNIYLFWPLRYKSEGRGFDSRWCHWIFFIDIILPAALWPRGWLSL